VTEAACNVVGHKARLPVWHFRMRCPGTY